MTEQTPQQEATQLLAEIVRELQDDSLALKPILLKCQHACQLLGWNSERDWFQAEGNGYLAGASLPQYRRVKGRFVWRARVSPADHYVMKHREFMAEVGPPEPPDTEGTQLDVYAGIESLQWASQNPYSEATEGTKEQWDSALRRTITYERFRVFDSGVFAYALSQIRQITFNFASQKYAYLRYGNALTDIWTEYRTQVDAKLHSIGFGVHIRAIESGINSADREERRKAVLECRNLLEDLARHLWRDQRDDYEHISDAKGKKVKVTSNMFANRLGAYLHQKGLSTEQRTFVTNETEHLATCIRLVTRLQSGAHGSISSIDAKSIALATYLILGELVTKTDMQPIEHYGYPATATAQDSPDKYNSPPS